MPYCEKCGKQIKDGDSFCTYCGATVKSLPNVDDVTKNSVKPTGNKKLNMINCSQSTNNKRSKKRIIIILIVAVIVVALAVVGAIFLATRIFSQEEENRYTNKTVQTTETATVQPTIAQQEIPQEQPTIEQQEILQEQPTTAASDSSKFENNESSLSGTNDYSYDNYSYYGDDYILPNSNTEKLTNADLSGLSNYMLELARNEIYAREGRKFKTDSIQNYFDNKWWYTGTIEPEDFTEDMLNDVEKYNVKFISNYEKEYTE